MKEYELIPMLMLRDRTHVVRVPVQTIHEIPEPPTNQQVLSRKQRRKILKRKQSHGR